MAWTKTEWACGHTGEMQLIGPHADRRSKVAFAAGRACLSCWLVGQWDAQGDPRASFPDRYILAGKIAEGKGIRIKGLPDNVPVKNCVPKSIAGVGIGA